MSSSPSVRLCCSNASMRSEYAFKDKSVVGWRVYDRVISIILIFCCYELFRKEKEIIVLHHPKTKLLHHKFK